MAGGERFINVGQPVGIDSAGELHERNEHGGDVRRRHFGVLSHHALSSLRQLPEDPRLVECLDHAGLQRRVPALIVR